MKVKSLGNFKPIDIEKINRPDHCMDGILVIKVLIKLTIPTPVLSVASFKLNTSFHMVEARTLPMRQLI